MKKTMQISVFVAGIFSGYADVLFTSIADRGILLPAGAQPLNPSGTQSNG
jgi:hypothetical protein